MRETLIQTARRGDIQRLTERLDYHSGITHSSQEGGGIPVVDQLIDEALIYAKLGDLDEATFRLRVRIEPKYRDINECRRKYRLAMAEKRARSST
jgi:hypothetical protein